MPTAHKLPSGSWRCQITVDGKRLSVTGATKKEAEHKAVEIEAGHKRMLASGITVGQALRRYVDSRDAILSPSTIQGYERMLANDYEDIAQIPVKKFDSREYQAYVNRLTSRVTRRGTQISPKAIKNICGLLTAALRYEDPEIRLTAALPAQRKRIVRLLSPTDVLSLARGSVIELPVLLACWLSFSMSEIRGLTVSSVRGDTITVQGAVVDIDGVPLHKESNKAYERTRTLPLPAPIRELIERTDAWRKGAGYLVPMSGRMIYKHWIDLQRKAGVEDPMSFHQLRHLNASVMLALGIPDTYAMERGGWSNPSTMKRVYQHTLDERRSTYDDLIDSFFRTLHERSSS